MTVKPLPKSSERGSVVFERNPLRDAQVRLVAGMREDLLPLAEAIVVCVQLLCDDATKYADDARSDVQKMLDAARGMHDQLKQGLESDWSIPTPQQFNERMRTLRHDIGNQINRVAGFCQLLLMDDDGRYFGAFTRDLAHIKDLCDESTMKLQRYKNPTADVLVESPLAAEALVSSAPQVVNVRPATVAVAPAAVLVADDNPNSREVLARILQRDGHTVTVAASGREALSLLEKYEFDIVLLDFLMPEMTGYEALRCIKADDRLSHTPVIMVSALDTMHEVVACIEIGAEDFLNKPVDVQLLRARVNACLEKKRLREREFAQFFTPELARYFVRHPEVRKQSRDAEVTVMFCDIRRFSCISERLGPEETVSWLSDVMATLSERVIAHRGVLVDFIGDELMAMWGAPERQDDHAELACNAAIEMLSALPQLSEKWLPIVGEPTRVGIGLNTGVARVGNTGSERKFKYGALGNTVNLASRVQGATKYLGAELLITGATLAKLNAEFHCRKLCTVRVVNIERPVDVHEVLIDKGEERLNLKHKYEQALSEFERENFRVAASILGHLLVDHPHDRPSLQLMSRVVEALLTNPKPFDPVWVSLEK